jgi:hypothetical protein
MARIKFSGLDFGPGSVQRRVFGPTGQENLEKRPVIQLFAVVFAPELLRN